MIHINYLKQHTDDKKNIETSLKNKFIFSKDGVKMEKLQ